MNAIRHILVHVNDDVLSRQTLRLGAALARLHGAQLSALLALEPTSPGPFLNAETASLAAQLQQEHRASHLRMAQEMVQAIGLSSSLQIDLVMASANPVDALIRGARGSDLLLVSQHKAETSGGLGAGPSARLLMGAGCPVLFVPHIGWSQGDAAADAPPAQNILVAWSDTHECARAVRDALPLLQRARRVEAITFVASDAHGGEGVPPALEVAAQHLRRHGVEMAITVRRGAEPSIGERMRRAWIPDASVAEALLSHAADTQAELIVMGGYGHPRAWEWVLGGVTHTLLQTMTVPVFMSH